MKKLLSASILSLAVMGNALAVCSDGLEEKTWDKTASGYCKIFFPECTADSLGKKVSYSREYAGGEVVCTGDRGQYSSYYKVSIKDANSVFETNFYKMGVNYTSELSKWMLENCQKYCKDIEPVSQYDLKKADDAIRAAEAE